MVSLIHKREKTSSVSQVDFYVNISQSTGTNYALDRAKISTFMCQQCRCEKSSRSKRTLRTATGSVTLCQACNAKNHT